MITPLVAPKALKPIKKESASDMVKLDAEDLMTLNQQVEDYLSELFQGSTERNNIQISSQHIQSLGAGDIQKSTTISSRLLTRPVNQMASGFFDDSSPISQALLDLRSTVEDLDPSNYSNLLTARKLFGIIPLGGNIKKYFRKYQSAQTHLNAIICSLENGKDELLKDNAAIDEERVLMWDTMHALEKHIYIGRKLDAKIISHLDKINAEDPDTVKIIREEILFHLRQKVQDLLTQLAVSVQSYLAMDMVRQNNTELIKGIDRSTTTTISALRTAVTVAQALANEKLVLQQISALNETTGHIIEKTSEALKKQSFEIRNQATSNTIELEKIKIAFKNIYETIDMIDSYKTEALGQMAQTIDVLSVEVNQAQKYLNKTSRTQAISQ
jgi:uncharacterized protein YaaN involved in tellurite resistance